MLQPPPPPPPPRSRSSSSRSRKVLRTVDSPHPSSPGNLGRAMGKRELEPKPSGRLFTPVPVAGPAGVATLQERACEGRVGCAGVLRSPGSAQCGPSRRGGGPFRGGAENTKGMGPPETSLVHTHTPHTHTPSRAHTSQKTHTPIFPHTTFSTTLISHIPLCLLIYTPSYTPILTRAITHCTHALD